MALKIEYVERKPTQEAALEELTRSGQELEAAGLSSAPSDNPLVKQEPERKPRIEPPQPDPVQSIAPPKPQSADMMAALTELLNGRADVLWLEHKTTKARYRVHGYDPATTTLKLDRDDSHVFEVRLAGTLTHTVYTPIWT